MKKNVTPSFRGGHHGHPKEHEGLRLSSILLGFHPFCWVIINLAEQLFDTLDQNLRTVRTTKYGSIFRKTPLTEHVMITTTS
mmetsp:Transcript_45951/g.75970  ORF Transcript_45951/g.75970 Transcript_45951/m.75970 type:complete len:82 (-) Transcript_45951:179-424(-)